MSICFCLLLLTSGAFGANYCNNVVREIRTPSLCTLLSQAEEAAENMDYQTACELLDQALSDQSAPEFSAKNDAEPLVVQLKLAKAFYQFSEAEAAGYDDPQIEKIFLSLIDEYKERAKKEKWVIYTGLRYKLIYYYIAKNDFAKAEQQIDALIDHDPGHIIGCLECGLKFLPTARAEEKINTYIKKTSSYGNDIIFMRIRYKNRDGGDIFQDTMDYLNEYPAASPNNINLSLGFLLKCLDSSNLGEVRQFYNVLNHVAMNQPNDADRIPLVSKLLDDRRKLEMIVPDVRAGVR